MLVRRVALRARNEPAAPKPAPSILFSPVVSDVIPSVIYTMVPATKEGYEVIHVSDPRAFIKSYYPRQILDRYDAMEEIDQKLLWAACVLYKHGGVCFLEPGDFTHEPSTEVGTVTVAYAGSSMLRSYILRSLTGRPVARPIVRPMVVRPMVVRPMVATPEVRPEARPEAIPVARPEVRPEVRPEARPEARPVARSEVRPVVRVYILCHNDTRLQEAARIYKPYPWAIPIRMKYQDCTFENAFWRQLNEIKDEWADCAMVGTLSFSAYRKIDLRKVNAIVRDPTKWTSGFHHFSETTKPLTNDHPHLLTIAKEALRSLGMESPPTAYSNYWIATPALMAGFINWYETALHPAVMSHPLILTDAVYVDGRMKKSELMALCNVPYYPHAPFVLERLSICYFKQATLFNMKDSPTIKQGFRNFCNHYIPYMRLFTVPQIDVGQRNEAVLIEYRIFPHIEFLIRNTIRFLGSEWSYTIVCGKDNYEYMVQLAAAIHTNIRVIETPYSNLTPSTYSTLLASADFWNLLTGEKLLIYQEDSVMFRSGIDKFLQWDYIGAPWPLNQNDAPVLVGNGGFSLRSKSVMLEVIAKRAIADTRPNSSTASYMAHTGSTVLPEDVYFSKNMQELGIGRVATWADAFEFSTETQYSRDSLAGHNFWLCDPAWELRLYKSLFKFAHVRTPYGLNIGGGEKYLLDICNYFKTVKKCIVVIEVNENTAVALKTINSIIGSADSIVLFPYNTPFPFQLVPDYFFNMENSTYPTVMAKGVTNIYHCQFPFSVNNKCKDYLSSYDHIILNSEFTKSNYVLNVPEPEKSKIAVLYPSCMSLELDKSFKQENTFVVCGRIFEYNHHAHNKNFDKVIKAFNASTNRSYTLHVIGACYSEPWLAHLKKLSKENVRFHINCTDEEKIRVLKGSKFIINATGFGRDKIKEAYSYEHFGISIVEGLAHGCIPITVDGGFPTYYVAKSKRPLIYDSAPALIELLSSLERTSAEYEFEYEYYTELIKSFNKDHHTDTLNAVLGSG